jgi:hypothetical protein
MIKSPSSRFNRIVRGTFWIILRVILIFLLLTVIILFLLRTSYVQNFAREKIQNYLQKKLQTKLVIGELSIDFPKKIVLKNLYLEDRHQDTLLYAGLLNLDVNLWALFNRKVVVNNIQLDHWVVNMERVLPDSAFNYDFITGAFASGNAKREKDTHGNSQWTFDLEDIHLTNIRAHYRDDASGNDAQVFLPDLQTKFKVFDPGQLIFEIAGLSVKGLNGRYRHYKPAWITRQEENPNPSSPLRLQFKTIRLDSVGVSYSDETNNTNANFNIGLLAVVSDSIDLNKMRFDLKSVELHKSNVRWTIEKSGKQISDKNQITEKPAAVAKWMFNVTDLRLKDDAFSLDDQSSKPVPDAIDYSHLHITNLNTTASALHLSPEEYKGEITMLSFSEKTGFNLINLSGGLFYSDQRIAINNLILRTNRTSLKTQAILNYASVASILEKPGDMAGDVAFEHSSVGIRDLLLFVPALSRQFHDRQNGQVNINGRINGKMNNLTIKDLELAGLQQSRLAFSGRIKGLPDAKKAIYDIEIKKLYTTKSDIDIFLPKNTIPRSIRIPDTVSLNGRFNGTVNKFQTDITLHSVFGGAGIRGQFNIPDKQYDFNADLQQFDLGKFLIEDNLLGKVDLQATAKGSGFDFKNIHTVAHVQIPSAVVKGYPYKNLSMDLSVQNGLYQISSVFDDQNLKGHLTANGKWIRKYPSLFLDMKMDTINFQSLHLMDSLAMSFNLHTELDNTNPDTAEGKIYLTGLAMHYRNALMYTDSIYLEAARKDAEQSILMRSDMADLDWNGKYKVTESYEALKQVINHYYNLPGFSSEKISPQDWQMNLLLKPSPFILAYNPTLKGSDTVQLSIGLNNSKNELTLSLHAPSIRYEQQFIHDLNVTADTKSGELKYVLQLDSAKWAGLDLFRSQSSGCLANDKFRNTIRLDNAENRKRYSLSTILTGAPNRWRFSLLPDSLFLNYASWNISGDNFIQYDSTGLFVNHLQMNQNDQSLQISSIDTSSNSPIAVSFKHFRIKTMTFFSGQDSLLLDGEMNGQAELRDILSHPSFTSNLKVNNLSYERDTLGNLSMLVDNRQPDIFTTNISLEGKENDARISGMYDSKIKNMDMHVDIGTLNLSVVKSLSAGQVKNIGGYLKGNLHATGSFDQPVVTGYLHFDSAFVTPFITGERLQLSTDSIYFDHEGISLNKFTLLDSAGHKAVLDGHLYTKNYKHYRFDLAFNADNFVLVNTPAEINRKFYGKLNMDFNVKVKGDVGEPVVNGNLHVNKETDFAIMMPNSDPEIVNRQGVVLFVDKDHPYDTARNKTDTDSLNRNAEFRNITASANIGTDSSAKFTMIVNERTGDALSVQGLASLSGSMNKNGKLSLTGTYVLEKGDYNLSLRLLKRKFTLQKGSTITWTGDPNGATINITATYLCTTAPISLVGNQLSGLTQDELNKFNQRLPFEVNLKMQGLLVKPQITFSITLPPNIAALWQNVDSKLSELNSNTAEVNKQVFALLLFNTFISENPYDNTSGGNSTAALMASQSASSLLTTQLNDLAGGFAKHIDLTMNVNTAQNYNTSGEAVNQTALQLGVSKNLFGDRVKVSVGSDFQLAGASQGPNASNIAGNVKIDYTLTPDGKYMIRVYSVNQYNTVVEGQVVETGASFIITLDFDSLNELFQKKSPQVKSIDQQKVEQEKTNPG